MRLVPHPTATFVHVQNAGVTSCAFFSASASFCRILKSFQGLLISLPLWVQSPGPSRSPSRQPGDSEQVTDASEPYSPRMKMQRKAKLLVTQLCLTPCDPMDCSLPGSSVQEILQARILGWGAIFSPGDLPYPGIKTVSAVVQVDSLLSEPPGKRKKMSDSCTHVTNVSRAVSKCPALWQVLGMHGGGDHR